MSTPETNKSSDKPLDLAIGLPASGDGEVTARMAGGLVDMNLSISPRKNSVPVALRNLAKAINLALKNDFLETDLDHVYKVARVWKGKVQILHKDYIGLGDGLFASIGRAAKSMQLTLRGPDAASPEGAAWIAENGSSAFRGLLDMFGRKLNLLQEYEDKVPMYVQLTLDRLEARRIISDWNRQEWKISTSLVGLDALLEPILDPSGDDKM
jgi:hypothetical protein